LSWDCFCWSLGTLRVLDVIAFILCILLELWGFQLCTLYVCVKLQEYPFFTVKLLPPGFIVHIGGVVSARSVKLLDKIHNPGISLLPTVYPVSYDMLVQRKCLHWPWWCRIDAFVNELKPYGFCSHFVRYFLGCPFLSLFVHLFGQYMVKVSEQQSKFLNVQMLCEFWFIFLISFSCRYCRCSRLSCRWPGFINSFSALTIGGSQPLCFIVPEKVPDCITAAAAAAAVAATLLLSLKTTHLAMT